MNDFSVIEQEIVKKKFIVNGKEVQLGKLSFIQVSRIIKALAKIFVRNSERFTGLKQGETNRDDILNIIDKFDEAEILELLAIITKLEVKDCQELDFVVVANILETVIEFNLQDFQDILKNWQGIVSKLKTGQSA